MMKPVRKLSLRRLSLFWSHSILRMPSARQSLWVEMPIHWQPSLVPLQKHFMTLYRRKLRKNYEGASLKNYGLWWNALARSMEKTSEELTPL